MRWSYSNLAKLILASANYHVQWSLAVANSPLPPSILVLYDLLNQLSIWKDFILQRTFFTPSDAMETFTRMQSNIALLYGSKLWTKFFFDKKIFKLKCEVFSDANIFLQNCFWVLKVAKIVGIHIHMKYKNAQKSSYTSKPMINYNRFFCT